MELHTLPTEYVELLINAAFILIATALFGAVTLLAGAGAWGSVKRGLKWARQYVDEPTDYVIIVAGQKFHIPPEKATEFATRFIDDLLKQGDVVAPPVEAVPMVEVAPPAVESFS